MSIIDKSYLMVENSDELDTPLSLSCVAENLRMAAFYFDKTKNLLEHAILAVESSDAADLTSRIQSAVKYQAHALQYSSIAKTMIT
jgi:hypothetical protein